MVPTCLVGHGDPVVPSFWRRGDDFGNKWRPRGPQGGDPVVPSDSVFRREQWSPPLSLLSERCAIPIQEISRRRFAEKPFLRQTPMRALPWPLTPWWAGLTMTMKP